MAHGLNQSFNVVIASGVTTSNEIDLGRGYAKVVLDSTGAGSSLSFQVAPCVAQASGTYRDLKYEVTSGISAPQTATVGSAASGAYCEVPPLAGHRFVKVLLTAAAANGATLKLICADMK